jgi:signal transduction histidine kinase
VVTLLAGNPSYPEIVERLELRTATPAERRPFQLVEGPDGGILAGNLPQWPERPSGDGWQRFEFEVYEAGGDDEFEVLARDIALPDGGRLLLGRDTEDLDEREELLGQAIGWGTGVTLLTGLLGAMLMTRAVGRRIDGVRRTAEQVMTGDLSRRVALSGSGDDFDRLAETLNAMLARIEALMESVRRVSDSVAHELRTPLTHLRADLEELATAGGPADPDRRALAEQALAGAQRLQSTFDALLRIARVETGQLRAGFRRVDLTTVLNDVAELYQPAAEGRGQRLETRVADALTVEGDPDLLFQAAANLIDNAVKHGPEDGSVLLSAAHAGRQVEIRVADSGPGIPEGERERVFDRFYRVPGRDALPGLGLGLSLVRSVAELHGGTIRFGDPDDGSIAILRLPASNGAPTRR